MHLKVYCHETGRVTIPLLNQYISFFQCQGSLCSKFRRIQHKNLSKLTETIMLTDDDNIITIQLQNIYQNQLNLHILVKNLQNTLCVNIQHTSYFSLKCNFGSSVFVFYPLCSIYINSCHVINHIGGVMVSMLTSMWKIVGLSPGRVKPKTIKLVFVASPLSTQH